MSKKVLIIEDEVDIRDAIAEAVTEAGFATSVAENGSVGLTKALEEHPDIILLDIIMPIMDGHETLRRLRQDTWGKQARVIMLTSMDDVSNIAGAHTGKIEDYIIKTHNSLDEIVAKVKLLAYSA